MNFKRQKPKRRRPLHSIDHPRVAITEIRPIEIEISDRLELLDIVDPAASTVLALSLTPPVIC